MNSWKFSGGWLPWEVFNPFYRQFPMCIGWISRNPSINIDWGLCNFMMACQPFVGHTEENSDLKWELLSRPDVYEGWTLQTCVDISPTQLNFILTAFGLTWAQQTASVVKTLSDWPDISSTRLCVALNSNFLSTWHHRKVRVGAKCVQAWSGS